MQEDVNLKGGTGVQKKETVMKRRENPQGGKNEGDDVHTRRKRWGRVEKEGKVE